MHTPPPPEDDLRFSNTTGILQQQPKKLWLWFIGVEVEQGTSAPPPKKNPGSAPEYYHSHSYCAYVEKLFENQIFLHFLSTTQQWKQERHETLPLCLFMDILFCLKFLALDVHSFDFCVRIPITGPPPITPKQVPPPPHFPHSRSQKASSPFGGITRRHADAHSLRSSQTQSFLAGYHR